MMNTRKDQRISTLISYGHTREVAEATVASTPLDTDHLPAHGEIPIPESTWTPLTPDLHDKLDAAVYAEPDEAVEQVVIIQPAEPEQFLPLPVRRTLYVVALIMSVVAPVVALLHPDLAPALVAGAGLLNAAAVGTALANPTK